MESSELYLGRLGPRRGDEAGPGGARVGRGGRRRHGARERGARHRLPVEPDRQRVRGRFYRLEVHLGNTRWEIITSQMQYFS